MASTTSAGERPMRLVGAWWVPALALSALGLYLAMQVTSSEGAVRESFYNAAHPWSVYVFMSALAGLLVYGLVRHASLWALGAPTQDSLLKDLPLRWEMTVFVNMEVD